MNGQINPILLILAVLEKVVLLGVPIGLLVYAVRHRLKKRSPLAAYYGGGPRQVYVNESYEDLAASGNYTEDVELLS